MNMAKYGSLRPQPLGNVNFEPIIRGLKNDIFDCKRKKWGKKWMEIGAIKGGGLV